MKSLIKAETIVAIVVLGVFFAFNFLSDGKPGLLSGGKPGPISAAAAASFSALVILVFLLVVSEGYSLLAASFTAAAAGFTAVAIGSGNPIVNTGSIFHYIPSIVAGFGAGVIGVKYAKEKSFSRKKVLLSLLTEFVVILASMLFVIL